MIVHEKNSMSFTYCNCFQLSTEVMTLLEEFKGQSVETYTFEMYTTFQRFIELSQHIEKE